MRTLQMIVLVLTAALLSSCGKSEKPASPSQGDVKVDVTSKGIVATDGKGAKVMASAAGTAGVPENFPKDVPIIAGAKIAVAMVLTDAATVNLTAPSSPDDAARFYAENLKAQGWKVGAPANVAGRTMLSAKKDKRDCNVAVGKNADGSAIQIMVTGL